MTHKTNVVIAVNPDGSEVLVQIHAGLQSSVIFLGMRSKRLCNQYLYFITVTETCQMEFTFNLIHFFF